MSTSSQRYLRGRTTAPILFGIGFGMLLTAIDPAVRTWEHLQAGGELTSRSSTSLNSVVLPVLGALFIVASVWFLIQRRPAIELDETAITVDDGGAARRIEWRELTALELRTGRPGLTGSQLDAIAVTRTDGTTETLEAHTGQVPPAWLQGALGRLPAHVRPFIATTDVDDTIGAEDAVIRDSSTRLWVLAAFFAAFVVFAIVAFVVLVVRDGMTRSAIMPIGVLVIAGTLLWRTVDVARRAAGAPRFVLTPTALRLVGRDWFPSTTTVDGALPASIPLAELRAAAPVSVTPRPLSPNRQRGIRLERRDGSALELYFRAVQGGIGQAVDAINAAIARAHP